MSDQPVFIVDTREKAPYGFEGFKVIRKKLDYGDYSLEGFENRLAFERKALDDYIGSLVQSRERFMKEVCQLSTFECKGVVVEGSLEDIIQHKYTSGANPKAILGATTSLIVDFGIPVYFLSNRQIARYFLEDLFVRFHRKRATISKE